MAPEGNKMGLRCYCFPKSLILLTSKVGIFNLTSRRNNFNSFNSSYLLLFCLKKTDKKWRYVQKHEEYTVRSYLYENEVEQGMVISVLSGSNRKREVPPRVDHLIRKISSRFARSICFSTG